MPKCMQKVIATIWIMSTWNLYVGILTFNVMELQERTRAGISSRQTPHSPTKGEPREKSSSWTDPSHWIYSHFDELRIPQERNGLRRPS